MSLETFLLLVALTAIYTMAVYRIAMLVSLERGPADLAAKLRSALMRRFPPPANGAEYLPPDQSQKHWIVSGAQCANCISFWLAPIAVALIGMHLISPGWALYVCDAVALWWAISGVVVAM
jgi:hypothetical protein